VYEKVGRTFGWCDETEAAVIIPLGRGAVGSHASGLTLQISDAPMP
jgi:hypothetical protein